MAFHFKGGMFWFKTNKGFLATETDKYGGNPKFKLQNNPCRQTTKYWMYLQCYSFI